MATLSSILAWRIPRTEEPGKVRSMGSQSQTHLSDRTRTHSGAKHGQRTSHFWEQTWTWRGQVPALMGGISQAPWGLHGAGPPDLSGKGQDHVCGREGGGPCAQGRGMNWPYSKIVVDDYLMTTRFGFSETVTSNNTDRLSR